MCVFLVTCGSMNNKEVAIQTNACWLLLLLLPVLYLTPLNAPCIKNTHPWIPTTEYWILTPQPATAVNGWESHHSHSNCIVVAATNLQSVKYQIQNVQFTNKEIYTCVYEQICGLHLTSAKNRKKPQLYVHFHHKITIDYKMLVNFARWESMIILYKKRSKARCEESIV